MSDWCNEWGGPRIVIRSATLPSGPYHFSVITLCDLYAEKASITLAKANLPHAAKLYLFLIQMVFPSYRFTDHEVDLSSEDKPYYQQIFLFFLFRRSDTVNHFPCITLFMPISFLSFDMYAFCCFLTILLLYLCIILSFFFRGDMFLYSNLWRFRTFVALISSV